MRRLFLLEAVLLGACPSALGAVLGAAACMGVAVVGALIPSWIAARRAPIEALKQ